MGLSVFKDVEIVWRISMESYWICGPCAKKKKWKFPKHPVTAKIGLCEYCFKKKKQTLMPIVDFDRGKDGRAIWD